MRWVMLMLLAVAACGSKHDAPAAGSGGSGSAVAKPAGLAVFVDGKQVATVSQTQLAAWPRVDQLVPVEARRLGRWQDREPVGDVSRSRARGVPRRGRRPCVRDVRRGRAREEGQAAAARGSPDRGADQAPARGCRPRPARTGQRRRQGPRDVEDHVRHAGWKVDGPRPREAARAPTRQPAGHDRRQGLDAADDPHRGRREEVRQDRGVEREQRRAQPRQDQLHRRFGPVREAEPQGRAPPPDLQEDRQRLAARRRRRQRPRRDPGPQVMRWLLVACLAACSHDSMAIEVVRSDASITRVELVIVESHCDTCAGAAPPGAQATPTGDDYYQFAGDRFIAPVSAGVAGFTLLPGASDHIPKLGAIGFDAQGTAEGIALLDQDIHITAHLGEVIQLELSGKPAQTIVWRAPNAPDTAESCIAILSDHDAFVVPRDDQDCDGVTGADECDPFWYLYAKPADTTPQYS